MKGILLAAMNVVLILFTVLVHKIIFVSALSKGGFSIHTNSVIMIARC